MQQSCTYGSVRGAPGNRLSYRDKARLRGAARGEGAPASDEPGFGAEPRPFKMLKGQR